MPPTTTPTPSNAPTDQFSQVIERLKTADNVLVTVSKNPSVDQLAACIGLSLVLNKLGKHGIAVFSGQPPSTIDFLKPDKILEKNTDSLRDFIISLDKSKADKLRYKVEDEAVKIYVTPYKTSISEKDLEFSQGEINIDAVVALGVQEKADLDAAIVSHGRILHDATVVSINTSAKGDLGVIHWSEEGASSLCEMVADVASELGKDLLDSQIATAFLTGIVAETQRFSNQKASPHTMSVAGSLMSAGASAQLVTAKLEEAQKVGRQNISNAGKNSTDQGVMQIDHPPEELEKPAPTAETEQKTFQDPRLNPIAPSFRDDKPPENAKPLVGTDDETNERTTPSLVLDPPQLGGQLTANSVPEDQRYSPSTDPLSNSFDSSGIIGRNNTPSPPPQQVDDSQTLADIEKTVNSPHIQGSDPGNGGPPPLDSARSAVEEAVGSTEDYTQKALDALNQQRQDLNLDVATKPPVPPGPQSPPPPPPADEPPKPSSPPPPVPPPMMPGA